MDKARVRACAPEIIGAVLAVILTVVVGLTSGAIGALLPLHVNRKMITALSVAAAALLVSITLVITVMAAHARQSGTVTAFFIQAVTPKPSAWRRSAILFVVYAWPIALAAFLLGVIDP